MQITVTHTDQVFRTRQGSRVRLWTGQTGLGLPVEVYISSVQAPPMELHAREQLAVELLAVEGLEKAEPPLPELEEAPPVGADLLAAYQQLKRANTELRTEVEKAWDALHSVAGTLRQALHQPR